MLSPSSGVHAAGLCALGLALPWVGLQWGLLRSILNSGSAGARSPGSFFTTFDGFAFLCCCGLCLCDLILTFGAEKWRCCCTATAAAECHRVGLLGHLDRGGYQCTNAIFLLLQTLFTTITASSKDNPLPMPVRWMCIGVTHQRDRPCWVL